MDCRTSRTVRNISLSWQITQSVVMAQICTIRALHSMNSNPKSGGSHEGKEHIKENAASSDNQSH